MTTLHIIVLNTTTVKFDYVICERSLIIKSEILTYSKYNVHTTENEVQEEVQALNF